jgi:ATP-dependent Clp protease ATP-binding subunit ClpC
LNRRPALETIRAEAAMFKRFTDRAGKALRLANDEARQSNHELIGTEHLLLGLMREDGGIAGMFLRNLDVDLAGLRSEIEKVLRPGQRSFGAGPLPMTPRLKRLIQHAFEEADRLGHGGVDTGHLLLGLFRERDGISAHALRSLGVDVDAARDELLNLLGASGEGGEDGGSPAGPAVGHGAACGPLPALAQGCPMCDPLLSMEGDPAFITHLSASDAVLSDNQGCRGWCVLIYRGHAEHLAGLPDASQHALWDDVLRMAAAIRATLPNTGAGGGPPRINYECLGNLVPHIHWHVIPRHADDPEPTRPVWGWPEERLRGSMGAVDRKNLAARLRAALGA